MRPTPSKGISTLMDSSEIPAELVEFRQAALDVKTLTVRPADDELLILYGLFKQGLNGDNTTSKPGFFDLKGRYKWDAWTKNKGMSKEEAQAKYIAHVATLKAKYSS